MRATEIVLHFDEREIEALQNALDCFSDESCTVEQKLREAFDSLYTEFVPPEMQNAIEIEILKENIARQEQIEADKRFGLFHIRENNEDRYYDALTKPQAIKDFYENDELIAITKELADTLRRNKTIDWQKRESARAKMRMLIKKLLKKHKYPPEGMLSKLL